MNTCSFEMISKRLRVNYMERAWVAFSRWREGFLGYRSENEMVESMVTLYRKFPPCKRKSQGEEGLQSKISWKSCHMQPTLGRLLGRIIVLIYLGHMIWI